MRLLVPAFSLTLFLSAFLLFGVQPLFSKMVLPYLGGSPMVWNTAMVFFQAMLLAGYGYAYFSSRLKSVRLQLGIHAVIFLVFLSFLPFSINKEDIPSDITNPTLWQIGMMLATIGPPFFILAGCAPLLQSWFAKSNHKDAHNPYFLYAASNVGSMLALLSYPVITEPLLGITEQVYIWSGLYVLLILMIVISGLLVIKNPNKIIEKVISSTETSENIEKPTWKIRGLWLVLAFVPSSLMLGVTTYVTTDIASVPLLWIIPLAIYVGTFIIAFANKRIVSTETMSFLHVIALIMVCMGTFLSVVTIKEIYLGMQIIIVAVITLSCHMRLADSKPHSSHLTEFYFLMSLGGVLGGIFNALIAPLIFTQTWEYTIILILSAFLVNPAALKLEVQTRNFFKDGILLYKIIPLVFFLAFGSLVFLFKTSETTANPTLYTGLILVCMLALLFIYNLRFVFACIVTIALLNFPVHSLQKDPQSLNGEAIFVKRNFFGTTLVIDNDNLRSMKHGTTIHGLQSKNTPLEPIGYYARETSVGEAFTYFTENDLKKKVGILGLGTGGLACYTAPDREFEFFEIDPDVVALSEEHGLFTYLKKCGNPYKIIIGDARLKVQEVPDGYYDLLMADAFSSDNIPVHLMTEEAIALYLKKIKDDGVLLIHISNRHIDLRPVLATIAKNLGLNIISKKSIDFDTELQAGKTIFPTNLVIISKRPEVIEPLKKQGWEQPTETDPVYHWTDEYVNILAAFKFYRSLTGKGDGMN